MDKRGRLLAKLADEETMKQISVPAPPSAFNTNVRGRIYRLIKAGSFLITDVGYLGFIHESQRRREPRLGELVEGRVIAVKEDGTMNVSLLPRKQEVYKRMPKRFTNISKVAVGRCHMVTKAIPKIFKRAFI